MDIENLSDHDLVKRLQSDSCEPSLIELIKRHSSLCFNICNKYSSAMAASGVYPSDVSEQKDYLVYKSALTFNPDKKTKFSTWLGNYTRYQCLNAMSSHSKHICVDSAQLNFLKEKEALREQRIDPRSELDNVEYVFNILSHLKDVRILKIFKLRYLYDSKKKMTWAKIGKKLKISTQTAINLHEKGRKFVKTKISQGSFSDIT